MLVGISEVLSNAEVRTLRRALNKNDFIDGSATAGYRAKLVKSNLQLDSNSKIYQQVSDVVLNALINNTAFNDLSYPKAISRPIFARYTKGMSYGFHVDSAVMNKPNSLRTDLSVTVFLNEPNDYEGGELLVKTPYGDQQIKLNAGDAVVYDSGHVHAVRPVTKGERLVAVTWVQSFIREFQKRQMLNEIKQIQNTLHAHLPTDVSTDLAYKTYQNLLRMWVET